MNEIVKEEKLMDLNRRFNRKKIKKLKKFVVKTPLTSKIVRAEFSYRLCNFPPNTTLFTIGVV